MYNNVFKKKKAFWDVKVFVLQEKVIEKKTNLIHSVYNF